MSAPSKRLAYRILLVAQIAVLTWSSTSCSLLPTTGAGEAQAIADLRSAREFEALVVSDGRLAVKTYLDGVKALRADLRAQEKASSGQEAVALARASKLMDELVSTGENAEFQSLGADGLGRLLPKLRQIRDAAEPTSAELDDKPFMDAWLEVVGKEDKLWRDTIAPILRDGYEGEQWRRLVLFDRKYFGVDGEKSNFMEAALNGWLRPTRSLDQLDSEASSWPRVLGVSRLEVIARIEPIMTITNGSLKGAVGAAGITEHFFPDFKAVPGSASGWKVEEDFWSQYVKRVGVQVGVAALDQNEGNLDAALGLGLQINSFTIWCLRDFERDDWLLAIGLSDFKVLKNLLPSL